VGPRAGLDAVVKRKIPSFCRDSNPRSYSPYPSAIPLSCAGCPGRYSNRQVPEYVEGLSVISILNIFYKNLFYLFVCVPT
jgi:hypothetical protein